VERRCKGAMKLTIERAALLKSLGHAQSVVERRNTIPILSNVLVQAKANTVALTATDMDLTIVEGAPASVGEDGATTVSAHTLYDIVRKLPDGAQVELGSGGESGRLGLRAGRSKFQLATLPKEDFPVPADGDLTRTFSLQAAELRGLIDRTRFAISTEETRYYLNGIYLHASDGDNACLRAVATDGHRLARVQVALPEGAEDMPGVIVPRKTVNELRKLIDDVEGPIHIALSETRIRFAFDDVVLTSKLIDGTFPDYERVIPTGNDQVMTVQRKDFADAVDRVSTISTEKSRAVKLHVENGTLVLSATSPENDTATEEIEVEYGGPALEIGFNSRYLLDIALQLEGDKAAFRMADASSPTIIEDEADRSALYVLMPMRV
jgi:DNA polymerase-3 subunit beta